MKKLSILVGLILFISTQIQASLKFSPYIGIDYSNSFNSIPKPMLGMDFSYEFNNGIEIGLGSYLSKTKVASKGDEIRPNNVIDFIPEIKENPSYIMLKYNYRINDKSKITPFGRLGMLNTSIYYNGEYDNKITPINETSDELSFIRDETIFYGNNFYSLGLQYHYNNYFFSLEYKVRFLEQEYVHNNSVINYDKTANTFKLINSDPRYSDRTFKANSISFVIGYTFDSKNKSKIEPNLQKENNKKEM